jgi:hypothetical protein
MTAKLLRGAIMTTTSSSGLAQLPVITYETARARYPAAGPAERRHGDLINEACEAMDPGERPMNPSGYLEIIALGKVLSDYYSEPEDFGNALRAGSSWSQIAAARGTSVSRARLDYLEWAERQHGEWLAYKARLGLSEEQFDHVGLSDELYAEALGYVARPDA